MTSEELEVVCMRLSHLKSNLWAQVHSFDQYMYQILLIFIFSPSKFLIKQQAVFPLS